jgi:hypothetical protein
MTDEEKNERYRVLINNIYGIINSVKGSKENVKKLDEITEEGLKINDSSPEKETVSNTLSAMDSTINNLSAAISSMRGNMK